VRAVGGKYSVALLFGVAASLGLLAGTLLPAGSESVYSSQEARYGSYGQVLPYNQMLQAPSRPTNSHMIRPFHRGEANYSNDNKPSHALASSDVSRLGEGMSILADDSVRQGYVLKVRLANPSRSAHGGNVEAFASLAGHKVPFFEQEDGSLMALVPVSVFQKPGSYKLNVSLNGSNALPPLNVQINDGHYKTQNVNVSKSTEGLKPFPGELETIQALKDMESPTRYWAEPFISPTSDCQNSPFGVKRFHNGVATGDYHKGVDLRSPQGRPIRAISGGRVQISRMYRLHGGTVGIDHGQGIESVYIHMSKLNVKEGEIVKKGDTIGFVGSTGFATGPHLHWGLYVSGLPVEPNQWITNVPRCQ
jgi:murein DD-endopeptidase MepM/ murein hydrolase activator NlpD